MSGAFFLVILQLPQINQEIPQCVTGVKLDFAKEITKPVIFARYAKNMFAENVRIIRSIFARSVYNLLIDKKINK